jgi:hypothetical protein
MFMIILISFYYLDPAISYICSECNVYTNDLFKHTD